MLAVESPALHDFLEHLSTGIKAVQPAKMLHAGIHSAYQKEKQRGA
jgi:alpha-ketoglutaric semialdehyde dehydrogenase